MNNTTVYVGMDVHKENFTLCCYTIENEKTAHCIKVAADYKLVLKYIAQMRTIYGDDTVFICGYEAGCLGYTLYHQLESHNVKCIILAPTSMMDSKTRKRIKTDKRDAALIARCLAYHEYSPVYVPTEQDEQVKEFLRMRSDHNAQLKKIKQQILALCLRHNLKYNESKSNWTKTHIHWLKNLDLKGILGETLNEYLITYDYLKDKIERLDARIEELAGEDCYQENVKKLSCFIGIKTQTALSILVEVGDFRRFSTPAQFSSYLGLVPGEKSSGDAIHRLGITKAGNTHVRRLLTEAAQGYSRGVAGSKSQVLKSRQKGNNPRVIAYADKANDRLKRRYRRLLLSSNKNTNVAKTALARELSCFIWGMMTENIS